MFSFVLLDTAQTNIRDVFILLLIVRQALYGLIDIRQSRCEDGALYNDNIAHKHQERRHVQKHSCTHRRF